MASGLLLGTAFLMKQQGVFLMVFGGAVDGGAYGSSSSSKAVRGSRSPAREAGLTLLLQAAAFYAAVVLPYGLVCFWLWRAGVFDTFWFWTVTYAREYVARDPSCVRLAIVLARRGHQCGDDRIGSAGRWRLAGCVAVAVRGWTRPGRSLFVLGFLFCLVPCASVRASFSARTTSLRCCRRWRCWPAWPAENSCGWPAFGSCRLRQRPRRRWKRRGGGESRGPGQSRSDRSGHSRRWSSPRRLLVLVAVTWPVWDREKRWFFFEVPAKLACRLIYSGNPFFEAPEISQYLNEHMGPDDTLAVLGSEPEMPFYSQRHSATGYIYTYGLMEDQPLAETMQEKMITEIEQKNPKFILVVDAYCSWLYKPQSALAPA